MTINYEADCRRCFHIRVCDKCMYGPDDCEGFVDKKDVFIKGENLEEFHSSFTYGKEMYYRLRDDLQTDFVNSAKRKLARELTELLLEEGCIDFDETVDERTYTKNITARLIVGKEKT